MCLNLTYIKGRMKHLLWFCCTQIWKQPPQIMPFKSAAFDFRPLLLGFPPNFIFRCLKMYGSFASLALYIIWFSPQTRTHEGCGLGCGEDENKNKGRISPKGLGTSRGQRRTSISTQNFNFFQILFKYSQSIAHKQQCTVDSYIQAKTSTNFGQMVRRPALS